MAVPRVLSIFKVRGEGNLEFWVSNVVIIFSTVLGVYLAAQAGYKTALDFEVTRSEREGYFLRRALLDELKDNLVQADSMPKNMVDQGWRFRNSDPNVFKLQSFVWETMKQQEITFQLPAGVLTGVRRYYEKSGDYERLLAVGQGRRMTGQAWMKDTQDVREKIVPTLEQDIAVLHQRLVGRGVQVEPFSHQTPENPYAREACGLTVAAR